MPAAKGWRAAAKDWSILLLSTFALLFAIEISMRTLAWIHMEKIKAGQNFATGGKGRPIRIVFLGESTTAWGFDHSYPATFGRLVHERYPNRNILIINDGIPAYDTGKILADLPTTIKRDRPDIVVTMMGVNDFWAISSAQSTGLVGWFMSLRIYKAAAQIRTRIEKALLPPEAASPPFNARPPRKSYPVLASPLSPAQQGDLQAAWNAFRARNYPAAKRLLAPYLRRPEKAPPQFWLLGGKIELKLKNKAAARKLFDRFVARSRNPMEIEGIINDFILRFGMVTTSQRKLIRGYAARSLAIDGEHPYAHWVLGCLANNDPEADAREGIQHLLLAEEGGMIQGDLYTCLAGLQRRIGDIKGAISTLRRGTKVDDINLIYIYQALIRLLLTEGSRDDVLATLEKAERVLPGNSILAKLQNEAADRFGNIERQPVYDYSNFMDFPETRKNYRSIVMQLLSRGIKVVAVQYPNISAKPLEKILEGLPVTLVSNEKNFARALQTHSFEQLFVDNFGLRFGHFSPEGSRLVAESLLVALAKKGMIRQ